MDVGDENSVPHAEFFQLRLAETFRGKLTRRVAMFDKNPDAFAPNGIDMFMRAASNTGEISSLFELRQPFLSALI